MLTNSWEKLKTSLPDLKVKAMAFWTPLIVLNVSPWLNNFIVKPILSGVEYLYSLCCGTLIGRQYPRGNFETNRITKDPKKFQISEAIKHDYKLGSFGVSLRWGINAINASSELIENHIKKIDVPTLLLKAEEDQIVENNFALQNPQIQIETLKGALHAVHIEREEIFNETLNKTLEFFKNGTYPPSN